MNYSASIDTQFKGFFQSNSVPKEIKRFFAGLRQSVLGKTVLSVLSTVLKTSDTVLNNADLAADKQHIYIPEN